MLLSLFLLSSSLTINYDTLNTSQIAVIDSIVRNINTITNGKPDTIHAIGKGDYGDFNATAYYGKENSEIYKINSNWKRARFNHVIFFFFADTLIYFTREGEPFYCINEDSVYNKFGRQINPDAGKKLVTSGYFIKKVSYTLLRL